MSPFWLTFASTTCVAEDTLPSLGTAQFTTFQGVVVNGDTSFTGGISVNGATYQKQVELNLSDAVRIDGNINVSPSHLGQSADLVVYAGLQSTPTSAPEQFYMLENGGEKILAWDQNPAHLVAFQSNVILPANQPVSLYSGTFYLPGTLHIFFGYRLSDGTLVTPLANMEAVIQGVAPFTPRFESALCPFEIPKGVIEGQDVKCGYVTVPETHANPQGRTIRLAVAIFPSTSATPAAEPLVIEQGGPGGSTLDSFGTDFLDKESTFQTFRQRQTVVLIEQRGTLYSEPFLFCKELDQLQKEIFSFEVPMEEFDTRRNEALTACRDRFQTVGINLSAYNSVENAADMAMVMTALGYEKFNFYGVSYGTMLGQHLMRDYPQRLRSVILDAVVPLNINFVPKAANTEDRSLRLLFQKCADDSECRRNFPNLEQVFFNTVDSLNENPGLVFLQDPDGNPYVLPLTGDDFMGVQVFQLLYVTRIIPYLPAIIYQVANGDYSTTELLLGLLLFDNTGADGMFNSVICAEDADYTDADYDTTGLYPQVAALATDGDVRDTCATWNVTPLDSYVDNPVVSDIPTLVMSGEMDPITPPGFGEEVAKHLSQGYAYTFPGVGHGSIDGGECPQSMMLAFLENPLQRPDDSCTMTMGIEFATEFSLSSNRQLKQVRKEVKIRFPKF